MQTNGHNLLLSRSTNHLRGINLKRTKFSHGTFASFGFTHEFGYFDYRNHSSCEFNWMNGFLNNLSSHKSSQAASSNEWIVVRNWSGHLNLCMQADIWETLETALIQIVTHGGSKERDSNLQFCFSSWRKMRANNVWLTILTTTMRPSSKSRFPLDSSWRNLIVKERGVLVIINLAGKSTSCHRR